MNKHVTATCISVRTHRYEAGKYGLRDVKKATLIRNGRRPGLNVFY